MYDIVIIGGGPAGVSAAVYAASRGMKVIIIEKDKVGGVLGRVSSVTHYTGIIEHETGSTFADRMLKHCESCNIPIVYDKVVDVSIEGDIKTIKTNNGSYEGKAVIIASGTTPRSLGVPGEKEFYGKGVDFWVTGYEERIIGKHVFVVGGSDGALKETLYLASKADKVTLIHFEDRLSAIPEFREKAEKNTKIEIMLNSRLAAVYGEEKLESIEVSNEKTNNTERIDATGGLVFIYAGSTPNTEIYTSLDKDDGYIKVNEKMETNVPGVYAAGDIRLKQIRQASTAVSDGTIAGINASAYIKLR